MVGETLGKIFNRDRTEKVLDIHERAKDQLAFMLGDSWVDVRTKQKLKAEERRKKKMDDKQKVKN